MNTTTPDETTVPAESFPPTRLQRIGVLLEPEIRKQILAETAQLELLLGHQLTLAMFLRKTIVENWKVQAERYRKLAGAQQKVRP